jgi:hypothetical protein
VLPLLPLLPQAANPPASKLSRSTNTKRDKVLPDILFSFVAINRPAGVPGYFLLPDPDSLFFTLPGDPPVAHPGIPDFQCQKTSSSAVRRPRNPRLIGCEAAEIRYCSRRLPQVSVTTYQIPRRRTRRK